MGNILNSVYDSIEDEQSSGVDAEVAQHQTATEADSNLKLAEVSDPPDIYAKYSELALKSGMSPQLVKTDPNRVDAALKRPNFYRIQPNYPSTVEAFKDFDFASAARDDVNSLMNIEKSIKEMKQESAAGWRSMQQSLDRVPAYQDRMWEALWGKDNPESRQLIEDLEKRELRAPEDAGLIGTAAEQAPLLAGGMMAGAKTGAALGWNTAAIATLFPALDLPAAGVMTAVGFQAGMYQYFFDTESAQAFKEYRNLVDQNGEKIDEQLAAAGAITYGVVSAGLENIGVGFLLKTLPFKSVKDVLLRRGIKLAIQTKPVQFLIKKILGSYGAAVGVEAAQEMTQQLTQAVIKGTIETISEVRDGTYFGDMDIAKEIEQILLAGEKAGKAALVFGGVGSTLSFTTQVNKAIKADEFLNIYRKISKTVEESKLKERSPEHLKRFLSKLDANQQVWWSKEGVEELYQRDPEIADQIVEKLGLEKQDVLSRTEQGQDIPVRMSQIYVDLSAEEQNQIIEGVKADSKGFSKRDLKTFDLAMDAERLSDAFMEKETEWREVTEELKRIRDTVSTGLGGEVADNYVKFLKRMTEVLEERGGSARDLVKNLDIQYRKFVEEESLAQNFMFPEDNALDVIDKTGDVWKAIVDNNPDLEPQIESGEVDVFRATVGDEIRPGDYVAINKGVAEAHLENLVDRGEVGKIVKQKLPLGSIRMASDATEFIYAPKTLYQADIDFNQPKREKKSGRYVGAPDWIGTSPGKLASLRKKLRKLAQEGAPGRYWYENSSKAILKLAGGDVNEAEKIVSLIAIYSPNATVPANTTMALTAYYQWKNGSPIKAGFSAADKKATALLVEGKAWSGIKTNSFYQNLMVEIDPSKLDPGIATMDMWMAIAFDYGFKTLDQGPKYEFARNEINGVAKDLGWKPHQVQAAIWTAIKSRVDPVRGELKEKELKKGIGENYDVDGKTLYRVKVDKKYEHFRLAHKLGMKGKLSLGSVESSKYDFSNALEERAAQMSWEATPSTSVDDVSFIHAADTATKFRYLKGIQGVLTDKNGDDVIANMIGLATPPSINGFSAWEGVIGAGAQDFISVPLEGSGKNRTVKKDAAELLNLYAAIKGFVLRQDAVVWHVPVYDDAKIRHNGFELKSARPITEEEMGLIYSAIHEEFGTWDLAPGYIENGLRILNFVEDLENKDFQKGMEKIIKRLPEDFGGGGMAHAGYRSDGDYIFNNWEVNKNGEEYKDRIRTRRPDLLRAAEDVRARVEAFNKKFEAEANTLYQSDGQGRRGVRAGRLEVNAKYGTPTEGSEQIRGVHYSKDPRKTLNGDYYGTGMRGAERKRLDNSKDTRIKKRIHFYVDSGNGVFPESDVGRSTHAVDLSNIYNMQEDPLGLQKEARETTTGWDDPYNTFESLVVDRGFDGYYLPTAQGDQGVAVLLGDHNVEVDSLGPHDAIFADQNSLNQGTKQPKGSFAVDPETERYVISLFQTADVSTLIHETGHLFLHEIRNLLDANLGSEDLKKDYDAILNFLSTEETWEGKQELFARSFEQYVREGVAPTNDLVSVFRRFSRWLKDIYRSARVLNAELNPEIRQVFDRLFTTELEVLQSAQENEMELWTKEQMKAMGVVPDDEWYMRKLLQSARASAEEALRKARYRAKKDVVSGWRETVRNRIKADPGYRLSRFLSEGVGISYEDVKAKFGKVTADQMAAKKVPRIVKKGGMSVEEALIQSGFTDASTMVKSLLHLQPIAVTEAAYVAEKTAELDEQFKAEDYLAASKDYESFLNLKRKYIDRNGGKPVGAEKISTIKQQAKDWLDNQKVADATRSDRYMANQAKFSRRETHSVRSGKFEEASKANDDARRNYILAREAIRNKEEVAKLERLAKRLAKRDPAKIADDYRDFIYDLVTRFGLVDPEAVKSTGKPLSAKALKLLEGDDTEGMAPFLASDSVIYSQLQSGENYKQIKMWEAKELRALLKYLDYHGKPDSEKVDRFGVKILDTADTMAKDSEGLKSRKRYEDDSMLGKLKKIPRTAYAYFNSFNFVMKAMGGYQSEQKGGGFSFTEYQTSIPVKEAQGTEHRLIQKYYEKIKPHYEHIMGAIKALQAQYGDALTENVPKTPAIFKQKSETQTDKWYPSQIFALAFHIGNESNRGRIFEGFQGFTEQDLNQLLDILSVEDMDAVQAVWDIFDEIFDEMNTVHYRMNKFFRKKIPAQKFKFKGKEYRGGYAPVRYDVTAAMEGGGVQTESIARIHEKVDLMSRYESRFGVPNVKAGSLKDRVVMTKYPLALSLEMIGDHLADTVHYITHAEVVRDVKNLLRTDAMKAAIVDHLGVEVYKDVTYEALSYIANPRKNASDPQLSGIMGKMRGMATAWMLAYNLNVAKKQFFSAPAAALRIGKRAWLSTYASTVLQPWKFKEKYQTMLAKSDYMSLRQLNFLQDLKRQLKLLNKNEKFWDVEDGMPVIGGKRVTWEDVVAIGFLPIKAVDTATVVPLWSKAYEQMIEKGESEKEAIRFADDVVQSTQPSATAMDLTKIQRSDYGTLLSMFGTFTIGKYQQRVRMNWRMLMSGKMSKARFAEHIMLEQLIPAIGIAAINYAAWGDEDDATEEMAATVIADALITMGTLPIPIVGSMFSPFSPFPFSLSSVESLGREVVWKSKKVKKAIETGDPADIAYQSFWLLATLASMWYRVPITKIIEKIDREIEGD